MTPYQGRERALYLEALRVVPAQIAARINEDPLGCQKLVEDYLQLATDYAVPRSTAWSILCAAANVTIVGLVAQAAEREGVERTEIVQGMVAGALDLVASGAA